MADKAPAKKQKMSPFPRTFYVANVMEIFERMAWYGFFAVSSLYMTSPVAQGGLGFTSIERGILQGIIPFLLYLMPVITGALADRYGYRNTFLVAFGIMTPAYWLLGQFTGFWTFFFAFLLVAIGAATFKPVVVGTVGRTTDDTNRGMGFGIFYTIVNVGGFAGPIVAGYVRAISWDLVFVMSAIWIGINFIPTLFLYKEPPGAATEKKTIRQTLKGAQEVLGNGRFALIVVPIIFLLMLSGGEWLAWGWSLGLSAAWVVLNLLWNLGASEDPNAPWYKKKALIGNGPFVLYLLILSGFWASFQQIFITLPEYIRDFVDTGSLVAFSYSVFGQGFVEFIASVNIDQLATEIQRLGAKYSDLQVGGETAQALFFELVHYKVRIPMPELVETFNQLGQNVDPGTAQAIAQDWANRYRQVNPEYLVNLDALSIVIFQILVSWIIQRWRPFPVLIVGTIVAGTGIAMNSLAYSSAMIVFAILVFAFGEMIASPKSQEYVAKIAPAGKTALFMGYYFVSMALGNLFGGILSGWGYGVVAKEMMKPGLMWIIFGLVGFLTAVALLFFNKLVVPHLEKQEQHSPGAA